MDNDIICNNNNFTKWKTVLPELLCMSVIKLSSLPGLIVEELLTTES